MTFQLIKTIVNNSPALEVRGNTTDLLRALMRVGYQAGLWLIIMKCQFSTSPAGALGLYDNTSNPPVYFPEASRTAVMNAINSMGSNAQTCNIV